MSKPNLFFSALSAAQPGAVHAPHDAPATSLVTIASISSIISEPICDKEPNLFNHTPLFIGDIILNKIDYDKNEIVFEIINQEAVSKFLKNKELIDFLTDPSVSLNRITIESIFDTRVKIPKNIADWERVVDENTLGLNLSITVNQSIIKKLDGSKREINFLTISRKLSFINKYLDCEDLLYIVYNFIIPVTINNLSELRSITKKIFEEHINKLQGSIAEEFLTSEEKIRRNRLRETDLVYWKYWMQDRAKEFAKKINWPRAQSFMFNYEALEQEENLFKALNNSFNTYLPTFGNVPQMYGIISDYLRTYTRDGTPRTQPCVESVGNFIGRSEKR